MPHLTDSVSFVMIHSYSFGGSHFSIFYFHPAQRHSTAALQCHNSCSEVLQHDQCLNSVQFSHDRAYPCTQMSLLFCISIWSWSCPWLIWDKFPNSGVMDRQTFSLCTGLNGDACHRCKHTLGKKYTLKMHIIKGAHNKSSQSKETKFLGGRCRNA